MREAGQWLWYWSQWAVLVIGIATGNAAGKRKMDNQVRVSLQAAR